MIEIAELRVLIRNSACFLAGVAILRPQKSQRGKRYETKPALIGFTVEISYDPAAPEIITVSYPGIEPFEAKPLKIGEYCDKNPTLPVSMQESIPDTSRFLDALEKKHSENVARMADAISFAGYGKGVIDHV